MKNRFLNLILFLSFTLNTACAELQKGIVKPYTPSFITKNIHILTLGVKAPSILDSLLTHPLRTIKESRLVLQKKFLGLDFDTFSGQEQNQIWLENLQNQPLIKACEQACPLFLLNECGHPCPLSREVNPYLRAAFERKVSSHLIAKAYKTSSLHYVSFACGDLFQDLIILTKTLAQKPDASITIHLIDLKYAFFDAVRDLLNETPEITGTTLTKEKIKSVLSQLKEIMPEEFETEADDDRPVSECFFYELQGRQFITWLKSAFPQAHLSLYLHANVENYLSYIKENNLAPADIMLSTDIEDYLSQANNALGDYAKLFIRSTQKNPSCVNFLLAGGWEEKPQIISASFQKNTEDSIENTFEDENGEKILFYTHSELITKQ